MKKLGIYFWGFLFLKISLGFAQQDPLFSQYMFNGLYLNPAFAGSTENIFTNYSVRRQWSNLDNSPMIHAFSIHAPFDHKRIGIGLKLISAQHFMQQRLNGGVSFSYKINAFKGTLAFGAFLGVYQNSLNFSSINIKDFDDKVISASGYLSPDVEAGFLYNNKDFYLGFSALHLFSRNYAADNFYKLLPHYYAMSGYKINLSTDLSVIPSILFKYVPNIPFQADFTTHVMYQNLAWLGVSYRTLDAYSFQVGLRFSELIKSIKQGVKIGYNCDVPHSGLQATHTLSHEVMLILDFKIHPSINQIKNKPIRVNPLLF
jgi:type IX secretion system PorP/SprF family membrane protein